MQSEFDGKKGKFFPVFKKKKKLLGFCHPVIHKILGKGETSHRAVLSQDTCGQSAESGDNVCSGNFMCHVSMMGFFPVMKLRHTPPV